MLDALPVRNHDEEAQTTTPLPPSCLKLPRLHSLGQPRGVRAAAVLIAGAAARVFCTLRTVNGDPAAACKNYHVTIRTILDGNIRTIQDHLLAYIVRSPRSLYSCPEWYGAVMIQLYFRVSLSPRRFERYYCKNKSNTERYEVYRCTYMYRNICARKTFTRGWEEIKL